MRQKAVGIFIIGMLIATICPVVSAVYTFSIVNGAENYTIPTN